MSGKVDRIAMLTVLNQKYHAAFPTHTKRKNQEDKIAELKKKELREKNVIGNLFQKQIEKTNKRTSSAVVIPLDEEISNDSAYSSTSYTVTTAKHLEDEEELQLLDFIEQEDLNASSGVDYESENLESEQPTQSTSKITPKREAPKQGELKRKIIGINADMVPLLPRKNSDVATSEQLASLNLLQSSNENA